MLSISLALVFLVLALFGAAAPLAAQDPLADALYVHPSKLTFPPLKLHPPKAERVVLGNGMVVHLLEDHELPLISLGAIVKVGAWLDPDDKLGLAELTGAVMRSGGTASMTADQMNDELEFIAASVETGIRQRSGRASMQVLTKDLDVGLKIFADVLMHPVFAQDKLDIRKQQMLEAIRRRNDEPAPIASRYLNNKVYLGHPYGRIATLETVDAVTRDDLIAFHKRYFAPNNMILGVAGDFDKKQLLAKLEAAFSDWPKGEPVADPPAVPFDPKPGVFVVEKDVPQANLRLGHLGVLKKDPDVFALEVMDFILGGSGFTSRMMREIRSNRGLAYSVGSYFSAGQERGVFGMYCETKSKTTLQAIDAMKDIFRKMTEAPVSEEELKIARDSIQNSFVFQFQSAGQIVSQAISLEYEGLPPDYLEIYNEAIGKVSAQDVMAAAKRHLLPEKLTVVVVGKQAEFDKPLSTLGPVQVIPPEDFSAFDKRKGK